MSSGKTRLRVPLCRDTADSHHPSPIAFRPWFANARKLAQPAASGVPRARVARRSSASRAPTSASTARAPCPWTIVIRASSARAGAATAHDAGADLSSDLHCGVTGSTGESATPVTRRGAGPGRAWQEDAQPRRSSRSGPTSSWTPRRRRRGRAPPARLQLDAAAANSGRRGFPAYQEALRAALDGGRACLATRSFAHGE